MSQGYAWGVTEATVSGDVTSNAQNISTEKTLTAVDTTLTAIKATDGIKKITDPVAVTGTFWQATQPVSAAALPLPSGAATASNQTDKSQFTKITDGTDTAEIVDPSTPTAAWGTKGLRVLIGPTDVISNLPVVIDYDQHQVHEGEMWHWDLYIANLASAASFDIVFTVPNITIPAGISAVERCPHWRYEIETNDIASRFLYEGPTVTGGTGTARTPMNFERNGTYTNKLTILEAPTITGVGTQIDAEYFIHAAAANKQGGGTGSAVNEFILKNNTKYLFRVTSGANGCDIHVDFHWYEDLGV